MADKYPEKLKELQEEWLIQASKYNVFPMQNTGALGGKDMAKSAFMAYSLPEENLDFKNVRYPFDLVNDPGVSMRTHSITVSLNIKDKNEEGVLVSAGDRFAGISLYVKDNKTKYVYNLDSDSNYIIETDKELPLGNSEVRLEFKLTGEDSAKAELFINDEKAVALQKKYNNKNLTIENTIQTNGILIDEKWAQFFHDNNFLVGISLDGPKKIHDEYRKTIDEKGTFERVMNSIALLEKYKVDYNILSVITENSVEKASYLYNFYKRNSFQYIQLIPCMDEQGRQNGEGVISGFAVKPKEYGKFLCKMFDLWYEDFMNGSSMDIRMFSNLAQMAAGFPAEECGMNGHCSCYFVVEGDGSVYPCDFYCMDEWKLGSVEDSFGEMIKSDKVKEFLEKSKSLHEKCSKCPYFSLCRGGCRRFRESGTGSDTKIGLNYLCEAYEVFFEHTMERIYKLGELINKTYKHI